MRNRSRTHLSVEVMATLELTAVSAQLIMTDAAGILTAGSTVLLPPFGFRCSSSIAPGLQVWLRGDFTGGGFRGGCCPGRAGADSFHGHFPGPCWGSRAWGVQGSACWRCCLELLVQDQLRGPAEEFIRAQAGPVSPLHLPDGGKEV